MPSLVVNVVGDTSKLQTSLKDAQQDINRFAGRASSWDKRNPRTGVLAESFKEADAASQAATEHLAELDAKATATRGSLTAMGAKAGVAGYAIFAAANGVRELTASLEKSNGKLGEMGRLLDGLMSADPAKTGSAIDNLTGNVFERAIDRDIKILFGFDRAADRSKKKLEAMWAATPSFVDPTQIRDPTSPGAIANMVSGVPLPKGEITINVPVVVDGKVVAKASAKYNRRTNKVNTSQRNGPNAGGYPGRN